MRQLYQNIATLVIITLLLTVGMVGLGHATPAYVPPGKNAATYPGAAATPLFDNGYLVPDVFGSTPNWNLSPSLRKFVNTLPPLGCATTNDLGQCLPVAVPDIVTYPGSDYYEIEVVEYKEQLHSDLGPTTLRGYHQTNSGTNTSACTDPALQQANPCTNAANTVNPPAKPHFLGPIIVAKKDRPVRIKLVNNLPTGDAGKLFLPVDTTLMSAGRGPLKADGTACSFVDVPGASIPFKENGPDCASYPENRALIHLHGGLSPWISDGTPHQWVVPAGEVTPYKKGASTQNVPDMPDPGDGAITYYYTNQQSARLMFYHDHAVGLTRLNVYAGEVAGYMIRDAVEQDLIDRDLIPGTKTDGTIAMGGEIPLIIMDKGFVNPATIGQLDPTWAWGTGADNGNGTKVPVNGDLWWPHVYMPAENPADITGVNPMGRWVYGLWFWPPTTGIPYQLTPNPYYDPACDMGPTAPGCVTEHAFEPSNMPKTPNPSWVAEAFMDTVLVNGTAYPSLTVDPKAYRIRMLNGAHDRFFNLQLYEATTTIKSCSITSGGSGFAVGDTLALQGNHLAIDSTHKYPQNAEISVTAVDGSGAVTGIRIDNYGSHYTAGPLTFTGLLVTSSAAGTGTVALSCDTQAGTEVAMVPAVNYPEYAAIGKTGDLPVDSREGGVPDPTTAGPSWVQIGTEGGFLSKPAILPNFPLTYVLDPTLFNVGNVIDGTMRLGPAERFDAIVDFCKYAGKTLIMYNDAPAAYPAAVANNDYYTGSPDLTDVGGHPGVIPGYSPNTRTVMQIKVNPGSCTEYASSVLPNLQKEFVKSTATGGQSVFEKAQHPVIVGQTYYNDAYGVTFPFKAPNWGVSEIGDNVLKYYDPSTIGSGVATATPMQPKAIHDEMGAVYDDYGRMSARLGVEVPLTTNLNQTFVMQGYIDPPTEIVDDGQVQIWKITHNGVDTHPMHFHLFDVQLINRVGWDGFKRMPDDSERGWKETLRVSPLEDTIVALRPRAPQLPFGLPNSIRKLAPGLPDNTTQGFTNLQTSGPDAGQAKTILDNNQVYNFGDEYVWHCHILSHEEQDMMRPISLNSSKIVPDAPGTLSITNSAQNNVTLFWIDPTPAASATTKGNPKNEIGFEMQRCTGTNCTGFAPIGTALANATSYTDTTANAGTTYRYAVVAYNAAGSSPQSNIVSLTTVEPPTVSLTSPTNGTVYAPNTSVPLAATATAPNGTTISKVEFYDGSMLLKTDTNAPYTFNWVATVSGNHSLTAKAYASNGAAGTSAAVSVTILPVTITTSSLPNGGVNVAYSQSIATAGGVAPFSWSATGLPSGLTINASTGVISGTPAPSVIPSGAVKASFSIGVTVQDSAAATSTATLSLVINQTVPAAPSGLAATATSPTQVVLNWTDNANNEAGFQIQRATDSAFTTNLTSVYRYTVNLTSYTDSTVAPGTTYYYRVRSLNTLAYSATFSNTANVTTSALGITTTSLPSGGVNVAYSTSVAISGGMAPYTWSATGLPSGLTINASTGVISGTPAPSVIPSGAVKASFSIGVTVQDSAAATSTATLSLVINQTVPAAPSGLAATATSPTQVVLNWTDNANNEAGFQIQRATDSAFTTNLTSVYRYTVNLTSYTDSTVAPGTTYYYRVRSVNRLAYSVAYTNVVSVATP